MNAERESEEELQYEFDDLDVELEDRVGSVDVGQDGDEVVLSWSPRHSPEATEMLRFNRREKLLRIFPRVRRGQTFENPFKRLTELQVESMGWNPERHSTESERYGLLRVAGLPKGFSAIYEFGLGVMRDYRGLLEEIEDRTNCTTIRFVGSSGDEGVNGPLFRLALNRFEAYRARLDLTRSRGQTAVRRVIKAERYNAVADLFGLDPVTPAYGRNAVIRAITEEVSTGYVMDAAERSTLVDQVVLEAPKVAQEAPKQFGRLPEDIELVSLESAN